MDELFIEDNSKFLVFSTHRDGEVCERIEIMFFEGGKSTGYKEIYGSIDKMAEWCMSVLNAFEGYSIKICGKVGTHLGLLNKSMVYAGFTKETKGYYGVTEIADVFVNRLILNSEWDNEINSLLDTRINIVIKRLLLICKLTGMSVFEIIDKKTKISNEVKTNFFTNEYRRNIVDFEIKTNTVTESLDGKTFLLTGVFLISKEDLNQKLIDYGAILAKGVTKKLDYLILGDSPGQSKILKARELGVNVVSADDIIKVIG